MTRSGCRRRGTSFALWRARSTCPAASCSSRAATKTPSPALSPAGRRSPSVTTRTSSTSAPSERSLAATSSHWISASRDPRVPRRSVLTAGNASRQPEEPSCRLGAASVGIRPEGTQRLVEQVGNQLLRHQRDQLSIPLAEVGQPVEEALEPLQPALLSLRLERPENLD